jgi:23S rRNA (pseudouridine1915-N3)-methyltransferase
MKVTLIAVGTKMPDWVQQGYEEYSKRLSGDFSLRLVEIPAYKRSKNSDLTRLIHQEGERTCAAIPQGDYVVALTERGKLWDTQQFAEQLRHWQSVSSGVSLLVGGPEGLAPQCLAKAQQQWSLSPLTWPHPLVRVMVAEQLYRAWSLLRGHPYHR